MIVSARHWHACACHMLILKAHSDWTQQVTLDKSSAASPVLLILVVEAQACTLRSDTRNRGQENARKDESSGAHLFGP